MIGGLGRIAGLAGRFLAGPAGRALEAAYANPAGRAALGVVQDTGFGLAFGMDPLTAAAGGVGGSAGGLAGAAVGRRLAGETGERVGELVGNIGGAVVGQNVMNAYMPVEAAMDPDKTAPSPDMAQPDRVPLTQRDVELERHKANLLKARYELQRLSLPQDPNTDSNNPSTRGRLS